MSEQRRVRRAATAVRTAALWAAVREEVDHLVAHRGRPLHIVDLGGGTGELAVPLAELGPDLVAHVLVVDPSPDALAALVRRGAESDVADRVEAIQGDADTLGDLLAAREHPGVDLVCCHGVLEVVDDPPATLHALSAALAPGGSLSLLVAGRLAAVLARALAGELDQAHAVLTSDDGRWGPHDPLPRRFDPQHLRELVQAAGLQVHRLHGVRLLVDLVPPTSIDDDGGRAALGVLEQALAAHPDYPFLHELGAGLHVLARRA